jgi:hypothetical protein
VNEKVLFSIAENAGVDHWLGNKLKRTYGEMLNGMISLRLRGHGTA